MWGRSYPYGILLIFAHIFKASCMGTSSLTFAIDDTTSMANVISQVKISANNLLDIVFHEKSSAIDNMVLVSINEPYCEVRAKTKDRDTFRRALDSLKAHDTLHFNDCPEPSMQGILLALEQSHSNSYIYVFTDASAKDYLLSQQVMEMCQRKQSQIVFILTGYCLSQREPEKVYYDIAASCSGLVFAVGKNSLPSVIKTIEETINGNKTVMVTTTVPPGVYTKIPFIIDDRTEYAVVSVSGLDVSLDIRGPPARQETIMRNKNGIVIKLTDVTVGQYTATVRGKASTSVIIIGRTDFLFAHGFSELVPKTLVDTTPQPIAHAEVYLSIYMNDPKHLVNIKSVHILGIDNKIIKTLPLTKTSTDFYITNPFVAPSKRFQIVVEGKVIATGLTIKRISKIPITPQNPIVVERDSKAPVTTIVEGQKTEVDYDSTVKLTCKVSAYPQPNITWMNSKGKQVKSLSSILQVPYDYISYVTITNMTETDKYVCYAVNRHGTDFKTIEIVVKDAFVVKSVPKGTTGVFYGSEGTITCEITSAQQMNIQWYYADEIKGTNGEIFSSDKYWISKDGKQLKIKKMDLNLAGRYTCRATLKNHGDVQKSFSILVSAEGIESPVASGEKNKKATKGSTAVINCNVKGLPKPKISWQFNGAPNSKFVPLPGNKSVLRITGVEEKNAGSYKCVAVNVLGSNEHITTLIVQDPPKITTIHTEVYKSTEGDALLKLPCDATGIPKPTLIWKMNDATITPDSKYSIDAGALIIKDIKVGDTNSYTCEAKNEVGTTSATFKTKILQAPKVSGAAVKKVRLETSDTIECTIVKGISIPKITWQFMRESATEYAPLKESNEIKIDSKLASVNVLGISSLADKHAGHYKCVAENEVGKNEHVTTLIVESPPKIISNTSMYNGVEGDLALRIPCTTTGIPKPSIVWKVKGVITENDKYVNEDGALIIYSPKSTQNDRLSYKCEAQNYLGFVSAVFKAQVTEFVGFGVKKNIYIREGENAKLECDGYNSKSQLVRWLIEDNDLKLKEPYMYFENATVSHDGNYTCRVNDKHGNTFTHTYVVDVGRPPTFTYENVPIVDWRGDVNNVLSNCESERGKPLPDVTWYFNGKLLTDEELNQLRDHFKWGQYSCNVFNVHGSIQRSFEVASTECYINKNIKYSEDMPLILNNNLGWPTWKTLNNQYSMQPLESFKVFCPRQEKEENQFQTFNKNLLQATCVKQDIFAIDSKNYKLSDLHCKNKVMPNIINKKTKCLSETSELIQVGYELTDFLETYDVCFDHGKNVPLYTRTLLTGADDPPRTSTIWHKYPAIADEKLDIGITCKDTSSSCCYGRTLLVDERNFNAREARESTFIKPLNTILYWRPCKNNMTTWENINEMVRTQIGSFGEFVAWSGTHTLQEKGGAYIPRYLWKVLKFNEENTLAIVHVNDPSPINNDIKCENICTEDEQPWFTPEDKFTYCCGLQDFLVAFNLKGHEIGE